MRYNRIQQAGFLSDAQIQLRNDSNAETHGHNLENAGPTVRYNHKHQSSVLSDAQTSKGECLPTGLSAQQHQLSLRQVHTHEDSFNADSSSSSYFDKPQNNIESQKK